MKSQEKDFLRKEINKKIESNAKFTGVFATDLKNQDLSEAKELVENDDIKICNYSCYIKVNSNSKENLENDIKYLIDQLQNLGIYYKEEIFNIKDSYLSSFVDVSAYPFGTI